MTTDIPAGVITPDQVETRMGTLRFFDGFPDEATVVQEGPLDTIDPETCGLLAAVGIRKDKPFAPDERMQRIFADAAVGSATGRTFLYNARDQGVYYYPSSAWKMSWTGNDCQFLPRVSARRCQKKW